MNKITIYENKNYKWLIVSMYKYNCHNNCTYTLNKQIIEILTSYMHPEIYYLCPLSWNMCFISLWNLSYMLMDRRISLLLNKKNKINCFYIIQYFCTLQKVITSP